MFVVKANALQRWELSDKVIKSFLMKRRETSGRTDLLPFIQSGSAIELEIAPAG